MLRNRRARMRKASKVIRWKTETKRGLGVVNTKQIEHKKKFLRHNFEKLKDLSLWVNQEISTKKQKQTKNQSKKKKHYAIVPRLTHILVIVLTFKDF